MEQFRTVGEFERQESVLIIWPIAPFATTKLSNDRISVDVVETLLGEVEVIVCCYDTDVESRAKEALSQRGINLSTIRFIQYPSEIVYPRDFGAEIMVGDQGSRARVDFRFDFYGYATEDDELSRVLRRFGQYHADQVDIPTTIHSTLISEGGDREFNGKGIMMTIRETEVDKRNPDKTLEEVEAEFKRVFHLDQIIWLPQSSYDDEHSHSGAIPSADGSFHSYRSATANGHIDEICRFTDEYTVVIAQVNEEEAAESKLHALNKERLDRAYEVVRSAKNHEGKPFRILTMPVPEPIYIDLTPEDDAFALWSWCEETEGTFADGSPIPKAPVNVMPALSYCNFLIANDVVLAQKYYEEGMPERIKHKDEEALSVLQDAFPDKRIVQINTLALNIYGGGIHCHTRNIPAAHTID